MIQGSINQMLSSIEGSMLAYKAFNKPQPTMKAYNESDSFKMANKKEFSEGGSQFVGPTKPDMSKQFEQKALDNVTSKANYEQQRATRVLNGMTMAQKHAYALTRKAREEENNNG